MRIVIFVILSILVIIIVVSEIRKAKRLREDANLLQTVTATDRGTRGERNLVLKLLKYGIPAQTIFHDLYLRKQNGKFSQIDLVVATTSGIIVFEIKDYSGWIFGKGYQDLWTQVLAYGKQKYRFYNPIKQNYNHITALKSTLTQFENIPFYSVIVFSRGCLLRNISFVPDETFVVSEERVWEIMKIIQAKQPAPYTDKYDVIRILKEAVANGSDEEIRLQHIENITALLGKDRIFY